MTLVVGIETSCDETGVAVYDSARGLLAHEIYSQAKSHAAYGGVVPELASRDHVRQLLPMIDAALSEADLERPDAIAATAGPGLIGAVLVGFSFAKALAGAWDVHEGRAALPAMRTTNRNSDFMVAVIVVIGKERKAVGWAYRTSSSSRRR